MQGNHVSAEWRQLQELKCFIFAMLQTVEAVFAGRD